MLWGIMPFQSFRQPVYFFWLECFIQGSWHMNIQIVGYKDYLFSYGYRMSKVYFNICAKPLYSVFLLRLFLGKRFVIMNMSATQFLMYTESVFSGPLANKRDAFFLYNLSSMYTTVRNRSFWRCYISRTSSNTFFIKYNDI